MNAPRIYLAGPDVFFPKSDQHFKHLQELCEEAGMVGVMPTDGGISKGVTGTGSEMAERIYQGNMELIRGCDGIIANLTPFRGDIEPDSGTVFEVGVGVALGKIVHCYMPKSDVNVEDRVAQHCVIDRDGKGVAWDRKYGMMVEEFGQPANLMLSRSTSIYESFEEALHGMKKMLLPSPRVRP